MVSDKKITLPSFRDKDRKPFEVETEKNKRIINSYLNEQYNGI